MKPHNLLNRGFTRITRMTQIIDFGIDELFVRMTECFSLTIFDVFPCDALPAAEPLKSA